MKKKYLIAVCDILGFSNLVKQNEIDSIIDNPITFLRRSLWHSLMKTDIPEELPTLDELQSKSRIGVALFSDTILLYTLEDTDDDCKYLLETCGWLLFENMFYHTTRLRIGVSYGEAYIDKKNSIYVGKPIIEAHELEKCQEWSGGALTFQAEERIPINVKTDYLYKENVINGGIYFWYLYYYDVPLKNDRTERLLSIDWTRGYHHFNKFHWSLNNAEPTQEEMETKKDIITKWQNTKTYHEEVCRKCFRNNKSKIKPL
jgi:hypothetical protein